MRVKAVGCLAIAMLGASSATPTPAEPSTAVEAAVRALTAERRGVISLEEHYSYREYGPGHNQTREVDSLRTRSDGRLIAVHLLRESNNGHAVSADQLAKDQAAIDKQLPPEDYTLPLTSDVLPQYRFAAAACSGCPAGSTAITFTSLKRDDDHGDGIMVIDASHHIGRLEFKPSVLPAHVDSAAIVMHFGRVLPDLWDVLDTAQHYDGHLLFIHGGADISQTYTDYRRLVVSRPGGAIEPSARPTGSLSCPVQARAEEEPLRGSWLEDYWLTLDDAYDKLNDECK